MIANYPLPWPLVPLSTVARLIRGVSFSGDDAQDSPRPDHLPILRAGNISDRLILESDLVWVPESRVSVEQRLCAGDIAICMSSGSAAIVGKTAALEHDWNGGVGAFCAIIRPSGYVDPRYLAAYLKGSQFTQWRKNQAQGANIQNLRGSELMLVPIPLPSLSEQRQIVEILQEAEEIRRLRAEAEAKTAELIPAIFEEIFGDPVRNPRKWDIEPLAALINDTPKNGLYKPAELYGEGTPIIRIGDFTGGILRTSKNLQRVRISDEEVEQFGVCSGQILINRVNSIEHLGKSLLVASLTEPTVYESNMMRLDPKTEKVLPDFLIACLQHDSIVAKLRAKAKKAINQASINQTDVLTLQIPVPPLPVQEGFALQVAQAEELRASGERSLRTERALSAALSAHAFSGQLTVNWRESNKDVLINEARERDTALKEAGATFSHTSRTMADEIEEMLQDRTDGIYADLNREQRELLHEIERMFAGVDYGRYFTAEHVAADIKGTLHRHPQRIESHLALFAARGLIIPVSRPRDYSTGPAFAACYRLPIIEKQAISDEGNADVIDSDDIRGALMEAHRKLATGRI